MMTGRRRMRRSRKEASTGPLAFGGLKGPLGGIAGHVGGLRGRLGILLGRLGLSWGLLGWCRAGLWSLLGRLGPPEIKHERTRACF